MRYRSIRPDLVGHGGVDLSKLLFGLYEADGKLALGQRMRGRRQTCRCSVWELLLLPMILENA